MEEKDFRLKEIKGIMIISPQTDFTMSMESTMEDIYDDLCEKGYRKILFEFLPQNHITSGGMAILISLISESRKRGQIIGVTGLSENFRKTFHMVGITRYTTVYSSLDEALQKMSAPNSNK